MPPDVVPAYLRWAFLRAALARGWWITTAVHLVVDARLSAAQLVLVGVFQGVTVLVAEVPAGVLADTTSRRLALVLSHLVRGTGMLLTPLVAGFPALVATQCLWGLGWALSSGADVAWVTDELHRRGRADVDRVLVAEARWTLLGEVAGIVVVGTAAWVTDREVAMAAAGALMVAQAVAVARWPEKGFVRTPAGSRWAEAVAVLRHGLGVARVEPVVLAVLVATFLFHGGIEAPGRLREQHLVGLGLPVADPVAWFTVLALLSATAGAVALRVGARRIEDGGGTGGAARAGGAAGTIGAGGVALFALAPDATAAAAGAVLFAGVASPVARAASTVLVNRRVASRVRATVHSLASQAENAGEMAVGLALAGVAAGTPVAALLVSAALMGAAGVVLSRASRR